jgi:hypothetical protein
VGQADGLLAAGVHLYFPVDGGGCKETEDGHAPGNLQDSVFVFAGFLTVMDVDDFSLHFFAIGGVEHNFS